MESSKLGDEVFENPFATNDYIFETSPSSKNDVEYGLDMLYDNALDDGPMLIDNPPCLVVTTLCGDKMIYLLFVTILSLMRVLLCF